IEALEMIDIDHRNRIRILQPQEGIVESTPRGQGGEFVVIGQKVRVLDNGRAQNACGGCRVNGRSARRPYESQREEEGAEGPQQRAVNRLAIDQKPDQEENAPSNKKGQRIAWQRTAHRRVMGSNGRQWRPLCLSTQNL